MATIAKEFTFDAAHRLPNHNGKCRNLHGHTYRVEVAITGDVKRLAGEPDEGMVMDFGQLSEVWRGIAKYLDHRTILWEQDPLGKILEDAGQMVSFMQNPPTAEHIAAMIAKHLHHELGLGVRVRVWETPTSWAEA